MSYGKCVAFEIKGDFGIKTNVFVRGAHIRICALLPQLDLRGKLSLLKGDIFSERGFR